MRDRRPAVGASPALVHPARFNVRQLVDLVNPVGVIAIGEMDDMRPDFFYGARVYIIVHPAHGETAFGAAIQAGDVIGMKTGRLDPVLADEILAAERESLV